MRILVTGSRDWTDWGVLSVALSKIATAHPGEEFTVVHGGCPTGADCFADVDATLRGWKVEVHPAYWAINGRRAGILRNMEMVDSGVDICLAFIKNGSPGATHCANYAESKGIPVKRFTADA